MKNWRVFMFVSEKLASGFVCCGCDDAVGRTAYQQLWDTRYTSGTRIAEALRGLPDTVPPMIIFPCGSDPMEREVAESRYQQFVWFWQSRGEGVVRYNAAAAKHLVIRSLNSPDPGAEVFSLGGEKTDQHERSEALQYWIHASKVAQDVCDTHVSDWHRIVQGLGSTGYYRAVRETTAHPRGE